MTADGDKPIIATPETETKQPLSASAEKEPVAKSAQGVIMLTTKEAAVGVDELRVAVDELLPDIAGDRVPSSASAPENEASSPSSEATAGVTGEIPLAAVEMPKVAPAAVSVSTTAGTVVLSEEPIAVVLAGSEEALTVSVDDAEDEGMAGENPPAFVTGEVAAVNQGASGAIETVADQLALDLAAKVSVSFVACAHKHRNVLPRTTSPLVSSFGTATPTNECCLSL